MSNRRQPAYAGKVLPIEVYGDGHGAPPFEDAPTSGFWRRIDLTQPGGCRLVLVFTDEPGQAEIRDLMQTLQFSGLFNRIIVTDRDGSTEECLIRSMSHESQDLQGK